MVARHDCLPTDPLFCTKRRESPGVYSAKDTVTGDNVALKAVEGVFNTTTDAKRTLRELSILRTPPPPSPPGRRTHSRVNRVPGHVSA